MMIRIRARAIAGLAVFMALSQGPSGARAEPASVNGQWDATVLVNGIEIPFRFEIATTKGILAARSSAASDASRRPPVASKATGCTSRSNQYAAALEAAIDDGKLVGEYRRGARVAYPFTATRAAAQTSHVAPGAPSLEGTWIVQAKSSKGETAWRFIARQQGGVVSASILRVDGDTGTLTGSYRDGRYVLSHFSGARPLSCSR